jgi:amino acid adenylation domain-containing protein/non-ribosomal peptide synthase protein (TIGR01720 family)
MELKTIINELIKLNIHLQLKDGELHLQGAKEKITPGIISTIKMHKKELIDYLDAAGNKKFLIENIPVAEPADSYPLSSSQRGVWLLSQTREGNIAYNTPAIYVFSGKLSIASLEYAFNALIERHENLRTVFREDEQGDVKQFIKDAKDSEFKIESINLVKDKDKENKLQELLMSTSGKPFDLVAGPLLRASLFQVEEQKWVFCYVIHHIISDEISMDILINEVLQLYNAHVKQAFNSLTPLRIQYKDYAVWQQEQLASGVLKEHENYWLDHFKGEVAVLALAGDKARPAFQTHNGAVVTKTINHKLSKGLKAVFKKQDCTLFMGMLAVVNTLLHKYTNQEDIVIGTPIVGREHADLQDQIGFYVNTLALRTQFKGEEQFDELLKKVKQLTLGAYEHQMYPFAELVDKLKIPRDMSRNPLFDVQVIVGQNEITGQEQKLNDVEVSAFEGDQFHSSKFDMVVQFAEQNDELKADIKYNTDIYNRATIERFSDHLEQLIASIIKNPQATIRELDYLSKEEQHQLLTVFNDNGGTALPKNKTLIQFFEKQVKATPDKAAVLFEGKQLSYKELHEKSNQLANYLKENYKVQANDLVGILMDRSDKMLVAIWGVLKAGAAYVPIDPEYPTARKEFVVKDTQLKVLLTQTDYIFDLDYYAGEIFAVDAQLDDLSTAKKSPGVKVQPGDLAYIIYTSGSTGNPKGVMIDHGNLFYSTAIRKDVYENVDSFLLLSSFSFDSSIAGIFGTLYLGGTLVITKSIDVSNIIGIADLIVDNKISHLLTVPSYYKLLIGELENRKSSLKQIVVAGETCSTQLVDYHYSVKTLSDCDFFNEYGPTECTVWSSFYKYDKTKPAIQTIGKPVPHAQIYIVNDQNKLVPVGVIGEICIGGPGLSRGYLNNPELTAKKFVSNPFAKDESMYKTGDLGKWLPDGNIEFLGRKDEQVKIRGYRIELGEIESAIQSHPKVDSAIVMAIENNEGEKELVAYVVTEEKIDVSEVRDYLNTSLPVYMFPAHFIQLQEWPLTPNGKVDRKKLPHPGSIGSNGLGMDNGAEYVAPRNDIEERLVQLYHGIFKADRIGVKDNFFRLGGDSLKAIRLLSQIIKEFEVKLDLKDLFLKTVLEEQAELIMQAKKTAYIHIPVLENQASYTLSSSQKRLWLLSQYEVGSLAYNMPAVYTFEGKLNLSALEYSFSTLLERHEILRTVFKEDEQGEVKQYVNSPNNFKINFNDLRKENEQEEKLKQLLKADFLQPFDLSKGPLLRASLYQVNNSQWIFSYTMHHIISDGWSMSIMINELLQLYNANVNGFANPLPALRIQYKDYSAWQQKQLSGETLTAHKNYWLKQFEGELPVLNLVGDRSRPPVKTFNGATINKRINSRVTGELKKLTQEQGGTLFMGLLAAVNVLLHRYSGQEDIIIGTPIAGREHADLEGQIGFYLNTLALRTQFSKTNNFRELLSTVKQTALGAYEHQVFPFDELIGALSLKHDASRNPLFEVFVVFQNAELDNLKIHDTLGELKVDAYSGEENYYSKFDLGFNFVETDGEIYAGLTYNNDIYTNQTAVRLMNHLCQLLEAVITAPDTAIYELNFLSSTEKQLLLNEFNFRSIPYSNEKTVIDLFEEQVVKSPDNIALLVNDTGLTYSQLNEKVNQLSDHLQKQQTISANDLIGIQLERNEWLVISILAVLKTGAGYLPIDPDYPEERRAFMVTDANCKLLINEQELELFRKNNKNYSTKNPVGKIKPNDLAYVIYTSGSTGIPKGVLVTHGNLSHFLTHVQHNYTGTAPIVKPFVASVSFDISVFQLFTPLISGGKSVLVTKDQFRDMSQFVSILESATFIDTVPAVYNLLVNYCAEHDLSAAFNRMERVFIGGDLIPDQLLIKLSELFSNAIITVTYGPTEGTVFCTHLNYKPGAINQETKGAVIGQPIGGTQIYILDEQRMLAPIGVVGEICIGGNGVTKAYLNQPELSAEKFIFNPFNESERIYRTGDLGRWLPDGKIEFAGRNDSQVKVRGFRIELDEITKRMQEHEEVKDAIALTASINQTDKSLIGYFVKNEPIQVWPSISEYLGYNELAYYAMNADDRRAGAYKKAIFESVKGKVVVDVGTGPECILAQHCIAAGATKVYAIEILDDIYEKAKAKIHSLGLEDKIILIHGNVMDITLPEKVDYCVCALVGNMGSSDGCIAIMNSAKRFLKDTSCMIPYRSLTKIAAFHLPEKGVNYGFTDAGAYYMNSIFEEQGKGFDLRMGLQHVTEQNLISTAGVFEDLDLTSYLPLHNTREIELEITSESLLTGFLVWLNLYTTPDILNDIFLSQKSFLPIYFPVFEQGVVVKKGDVIRAKVLVFTPDDTIYPDYSVAGVLIRKNKEVIDFSYVSKRHPGTFCENAFYKTVFPNGQFAVKTPFTKQKLQEDLRTKLPEYMVPSVLVELDALPLTDNGKIDRKALLELAASGAETGANYVAPRNEMEQNLVWVYEDVLKKKGIGIKEDFFALGGDSIKAIQVVSRLRQKGYTLTIQDVLSTAVIEELAEKVKMVTRTISQDEVIGTIPLSPIQQMFLMEDSAEKNHFNQSVLLFSKQSLSETGIKAAFDKIVLHHDALRMTFKQTAGSWIQENKGKEQRYSFETFEYTDETGFVKECERIQSGIDLENGPLVKIALFRSDSGDRLLLVVHHLVIDGVSWRILFEDLSQLYQQYLSKETLQLPLKTDSFMYWQEKQMEYAFSKEIQEEEAYWSTTTGAAINALPLDFPEGNNLLKNSTSQFFELDEKITERLLTQCYKAYRTEINDILLTALGQGLKEVFHVENILIQLEGHGREAIGANVDVSRTIGWFTTRYPVALNLNYSDTTRQLIEIKESLHRIPNKGIGYGVLRYLAGKHFGTEPQITFNYLGDFGSDIKTTQGKQLFEFSGDYYGKNVSANRQRDAILDVTGMITAGKLHLSISYSNEQYAEKTIQKLSVAFQEQLLKLIEILSTEEKENATPVDFTYQGLSVEELLELNDV